MSEMIKLMQEVAGHGNADIKRGIDIDYESFATRARDITRNEIATRLYNEIPTGELDAFELIKFIKNFHDSLYD